VRGGGRRLARQSAELKKKTANPAEKATIEIVALMFQSILSEERLPPAIRVWFARLQVPVLRVALAEPEFFDNLSHPARLLIDRMGSCVLGFDDNTMAGPALEAEIRRIVQVIEQYPETGRRVFQLVYDEFQKFLNRFLTEKGKTARLVSVAQQVEQKEALAIQYTIELRNMLKDMPVRDEIRDFLFKTWAEVLALAAVRSGPSTKAPWPSRRPPPTWSGRPAPSPTGPTGRASSTICRCCCSACARAWPCWASMGRRRRRTSRSSARPWPTPSCPRPRPSPRPPSTPWPSAWPALKTMSPRKGWTSCRWTPKAWR
jgi:hypothetical protein